MFFSDKINLITLTSTTNAVGNSITSQTKKEIFADKKSIRQSEFYQAQQTGLRPELMFNVYTEEYSNQELLEYNNIEYTIIRAYEKGEFTELVCQGVV